MASRWAIFHTSRHRNVRIVRAAVTAAPRAVVGNQSSARSIISPPGYPWQYVIDNIVDNRESRVKPDTLAQMRFWRMITWRPRHDLVYMIFDLLLGSDDLLEQGVPPPQHPRLLLHRRRLLGHVFSERRDQFQVGLHHGLGDVVPRPQGHPHDEPPEAHQ